MGVLLDKENDQHVNYNWWAWSSILQIAADHGWEPMGTQYPYWKNLEEDDVFEEKPFKDEQWNGTYFSNDGQLVITRDAEGICTALKKASQHFKTLLESQELESDERENTKFRLDLIQDFLGFCQGEKFAIF